MNPKISIIIPVYNASKYLVRLVESINKQTFEDFEVLFINDGSSDNSYELLLELTKEHVNYHVINQNNSGAPTARNKGIEYSKGEYLFFSDSDDELTPNCLELLFKHTIDGDTDLVIGSYDEIDERTDYVKSLDVIKVSKYESDQEYDMSNLFFMPPNLFSKLIKKELIVNNELRFSDVKIGQDLYFYFLLIPHIKKIKFEEKCVYKYYVNMGSISNSYDCRILNIKLTINRILEYYDNLNLMEKYKYELQYVLNGHLITQLFKTPYIEDKLLKREVIDSLIGEMNLDSVFKNKYYSQKPVYYVVLLCFKFPLFFKNYITQCILKKILPIYKNKIM